jgi:hypothetical protein
MDYFRQRTHSYGYYRGRLALRRSSRLDEEFPHQGEPSGRLGDTIYATTNGYFNSGMRAFALMSQTEVKSGASHCQKPLRQPATYAQGRVYFQRGNDGWDTHLGVSIGSSGRLHSLHLMGHKQGGCCSHHRGWRRFCEWRHLRRMYGFDATTERSGSRHHPWTRFKLDSELLEWCGLLLCARNFLCAPSAQRGTALEAGPESEQYWQQLLGRGLHSRN